MANLTDADFADDEDKCKFLELAPTEDAKESAVRFVAEVLWEAADADSRDFAVLAQAYARDVVRYQTDTDRVGHEDIQPMGQLSDVIRRKIDDCDAKARLFVALCLAVRIVARVVPHWEPDPTVKGGRRLQHVSAEVQIVQGGAWVPVELTLYRARLGDLPADVPKETTAKHLGHWLLNEVTGV